MFLRRNRRTIDGESYEYWTLVESYRTERGPRQRVVATLGKLPGLDEGECHGWEEIGWLLEGRRAPEQMELGAAGGARAKAPTGRKWICPGCVWSGCGISARCIWGSRCGGAWACTNSWAS